MNYRAKLSALLLCVPTLAGAQGGLDLIVAAEETKTLEAGLYEYRSVHIADRGKIILKGGVTIAAEKFSSGDGATIQYEGTADAQQNISISTFDASELKFLYINANGKSGLDQTGTGPTGPNGRNARAPGHSIGDLDGRSANGGGQGGAGAPGENGKHAANVNLHLPNLKMGSLLRIHAIGGSGGKGQQGGQGGKGGDGAVAHPAKNGGPGGTGGRGGNAGNAGRISVYLIVADTADEQEREAAQRALRLEYANSSGTPGESGDPGRGGNGGRGAVAGGTGSRGSAGGRGNGGGQGSVGMGPSSKPDERWIVTAIKTQSQYAQEYTQTLQKIREAMASR